ncbi:MAG: type II secretion system protein [Nitrospirota bacterium]
MKKILLPLFVLIAVLSACQKKTEIPPIPKSDTAAKTNSIVQPVKDYAKGLQGSMDRAKGAQLEADLGDIRNAMQTYQMDNGRYPGSLDALKPYVRAGIDMSKYNYNSADGSVSLK